MEQKVRALSNFVNNCEISQFDENEIKKAIHEIEEVSLKNVLLQYFNFQEKVQELEVSMLEQDDDQAEAEENYQNEENDKAVSEKNEKNRKKLIGIELHNFLQKDISFSNYNEIKLAEYDVQYETNTTYEACEVSIKSLLTDIDKISKLKFFCFCKLGILLVNFYKCYKEKVSTNRLSKQKLYLKCFKIKPANAERLVWLGKLCIKYPAIKFINKINVTTFYKHRQEINNLFDEKNKEFHTIQAYWKNTH